MSLNMFLPSLPAIADALAVDYAVANLSIAGYAAITAVLQIVMGPLSDRFGRRPVILAGLILFCIASLGCALADNIWVFLGCRLIQGAIIAGHTVSLAVIRDSEEPERAASLMGYLAMAWAVAPMLGPVLGGLLDSLFGWRANFVVLLALGGSVLWLCWSDLGETNTTPSASMRQQFRTYPALLLSGRFWGYASCMAFSIGAFYAFLAGSPIVALSVFATPTAVLGILMGTITAGFMFGSFLAGRFAERYSLIVMVIAGRVVACTGPVLGLILIWLDAMNVALFFAACAFIGVGNGITMPSSNAGAMSVRPDLAGSAAGLSGALAVAGGAVTSAVTGSLLNESNADYGLLSMMLLASVLGLASAIGVILLERHRPLVDQNR